MSESTTTTGVALTPGRVHGVPRALPRFVRNLNAFAETHGLTTHLSVEPYSNDPELRVWGQWDGTKSQLISLGLLAPWQQRLLAIDGDVDHFSVPAGDKINPLIAGPLTVRGDIISIAIDFGPPIYTLADRCGAQIVTYADEVLYHGTAAELIAAGVCAARLPCGKQRSGRCGRDSKQPQWRSRRQPDGLFVHRVETEESFQRRRREYEQQFKEYDSNIAAARDRREAAACSAQSASEWKHQMVNFCERWLSTSLSPPAFVPLRTDGRFRLAEGDLTALSHKLSRFIQELQFALESAVVVDGERQRSRLVIVH